MLFFCFLFFVFPGESGAGIVGLGCHYLSNIFAGFQTYSPAALPN